jgi:hypothetical protein
MNDYVGGGCTVVNSSAASTHHLKLYKSVSVRSSLKQLCDNMRMQILSRAFYGWLAYHRHLKTVRKHLSGLINEARCDDGNSEDDLAGEEVSADRTASLIELLRSYLKEKKKLDHDLWSELTREGARFGKRERVFFHKIVYYNGIEKNMRKTVIFYSNLSLFLFS